MAHKPQTTPKIAVNALLFNDKGEVLLAKRTDNGLWCIPGGHVDLGETLAQACLRELCEETGLQGGGGQADRDLFGHGGIPPYRPGTRMAHGEGFFSVQSDGGVKIKPAKKPARSRYFRRGAPAGP